MNKIFYFLMVGFAFTVLQVGTVEAVKDCSDFKPGTPPFDSCVADNQKTAGEAGMKAPATSGTDCANAGDPTEVAACWDRQAPSAEATGMGAPGTAGMGAPGTASMGDPSCAPLANGTLPPHCK